VFVSVIPKSTRGVVGRDIVNISEALARRYGKEHVVLLGRDVQSVGMEIDRIEVVRSVVVRRNGVGIRREIVVDDHG
jgi:hypothetical protein